jgi:hypothetical protein
MKAWREPHGVAPRRPRSGRWLPAHWRRARRRRGRWLPPSRLAHCPSRLASGAVMNAIDPIPKTAISKARRYSRRKPRRLPRPAPARRRRPPRPVRRHPRAARARRRAPVPEAQQQWCRL